jgi:hypothetical protein
VVLHLGAGMPEHREIALYHLVIRSHKLISRGDCQLEEDGFWFVRDSAKWGTV